MKICSKCKVEKELSLFAKRANAKDGHRSECIECWREIQQKWRVANRDRHNELHRNWRKLNPEKVKETNKRHQNSPTKKACTKRWVNNNPERVKAIAKRRYENNAEKIKQWHRNYRAEHKKLIAFAEKKRYKRDSEKMSDRYLKGLLRSQSNFSASAKDFDCGIIELKRNILKLKREIKNKEQ